jgi:hypothetical protein
MSVVTTVVILGNLTGNQLAQIEGFEWEGRRASFGPVIPRCGDYVGGGKCAEADVRVAAFNHFPWDKWVEHLNRIDFGPYKYELVISWSSGDIGDAGSWQPKEEV